MEFIIDFWKYLKIRKKFWLLPIVIMLFLLGTMIYFSSGTAVAPFVYTLF